MSKSSYKEGTVVTATEFKQNLGKYLDYVCDDQTDVVITKNGNKIARLTPYVTDIEQYFTVKENALDYQYGGKKVSYEEFMVINEKSTLRMEYLNGEIYLMASPNLWHQEILSILHLIFKTYFSGKKCRVMFSPFDITFHKPDIKDPDVLQPDLFVICDLEGNLNTDGHYFGTPSLVLEILSISTRSRDMVDKLNTYMLSGVKEYWVIDSKNKQVMVYSFKDRGVESLDVYKCGDEIISVYFDGLTVMVNCLFDELPEGALIDQDFRHK